MFNPKCTFFPEIIKRNNRVANRSWKQLHITEAKSETLASESFA